MTIKNRLLLFAAGAFVILCAVGALAFWSASGVRTRLSRIASNTVPAIQALADLRDGQANAMQAAYSGLVAQSVDMRRLALGRAQMAFQQVDDARAAFEQTRRAPKVEQAWGEFKLMIDDWSTAAKAALDALQARERASTAGPEAQQEAERGLRHAFNALEGKHEAVGASLADLLVVVRAEANDVLTEGERTSARGLWAITFAVLAGSIVLALISILIGRRIERALRTLGEESRRLTGAVDAGELSVRGDRARVDAEFRAIVDGMNQTMDAFTKPIQVTAEYVDRLSRGDLPPKLTDEYRGDFDVIRRNLNTCIEAVEALARDALQLSSAAVQGQLGARAEAERHHGEYRKIVQGVNDTLDAVVAPMREAATVLESLAGRDLTVRVHGAYRGDHAQIKDALNATAEALETAIAQVAGSVAHVTSVSTQIAASSEAVASGASEQASALEETSASLESMTAMTRQASDHAQQANALAQQAKAAAGAGSSAMDQMSSAMSRIKASSEGTSQIIKDINEIAFQTNLLALNAAVEAARAGEAGRGFAVVAEEVRSLALRSKQAANKTEDLIRQSVGEASRGEVTARDVHARLTEIATAITKVSDIVAEIAATGKEQAAGIDQVTKAIGQVNQVTQQNAASSEESSSAAAELSGQSQELADMVATFRCDRGAVPGSAQGRRTGADAATAVTGDFVPPPGPPPEEHRSSSQAS